MEFFRQVDAAIDPERLCRLLTIGSLDRWCASIEGVLQDRGDRGEIYCLWGQFEVRRESIDDGVRFTLPACPNALQWTVTADPSPESTALLIHLTINRTDHEPEFVESIDTFLDDWADGLAAGLGGSRMADPVSIQWLPRLGVGAVVIHEGRVLLVRRARPPFAGEWAVPGGKVRPGETIAAAVVREVSEETGVIVEAHEPIHWFEHIEPGSDGLHFHYVVVDVRALYREGEPKAGDDAAEVRWIALDSVDEVPVNRITREVLARLSAADAADAGRNG